MATPVVTGDISSLLPTYIVPLQLQTEHGAVMRNLMRSFPLGNRHGTAVNLPKAGQLTAYAVTRGVRVSQNQKLTVSSVAITPATAAVHFVIDKYAEGVASESVMAFYGTAAGNAINRYEDKTCLALLDGFSTVTGNGSATVLKPGHLLHASVQIGANDTWPFTGPLNAVVHDYSAMSLVADIGGITMLASATDAAEGGFTSAVANRFVANPGDAMREKVLSDAFVKKFGRVMVYQDNNFTIASSAAKGGVFHRDALVHVPFQPATVESGYERSLLGTEVVAHIVFGAGEFEDAGGVELNVRAALYTS